VVGHQLLTQQETLRNHKPLLLGHFRLLAVVQREVLYADSVRPSVDQYGEVPQ